ncbi:ATP-dependent Lon protease [Vibrio sp. WXL103]|uniref:ATP-dependent Lon protease n=1 Tax=unclassified Vibrio TaxID=2614977 RepID=UPI003EC622A1
MIVSPNNVSMPLIAPSVNVQTEQVARENRTSEAVKPAVELAKANAERKIKQDDKRQRESAWDPAEHPDYELDEEQDDAPQNELERLFSLLALESYSENQGMGYTIRFKLPKRIIDAAIEQGHMARRRTVIKYHYGHSVAPHPPSDVIAVL